MPKLFVKESGVWKQVIRLWVNQGGTWKLPTVALINQSGVGKQFYPDSTPTITYSTAGTGFTYSVPAGVTSLEVTLVGGGGGGQTGWGNVSGDSGGGGAGGAAGSVTTTTISVTPGSVLPIVVGAGGGGGARAGGFPGGTSPDGPGGADGGSSTLTNGPSTITAAGGLGGAKWLNQGASPTGGNGFYPGSSGSFARGQNGAAATFSGSSGGLGATSMSVNGGNGVLGGGGGGGAAQSVGDTQTAGGNGGAGYVSIRPLNANVSTYSIPNTYTLAIPAGITSVNVTYPTITGLVTQSYTVTPLTNLTITIGDYGANSTVTGGTGTVTMPAYSKVVFNHTAGNVDANLTQTFSVATANVATASTTNTTQGPSATNLNVNGIFFSTDFENNQGDFGESITISTVPIATLVGTYRMVGEITSSRGASGFSSGPTLPTPANNWRSQFNITETGFSNFLVLWNIRVEQQGYFLISY